MWPLQHPGKRNGRVAQGSHVNLKTQGQNDQNKYWRAKEKYTNRCVGESGSGDGRWRVYALCGATRHGKLTKNEIKSPSWTSSSAAQAHDTTSCGAE